MTFSGREVCQNSFLFDFEKTSSSKIVLKIGRMAKNPLIMRVFPDDVELIDINCIN